MEDPFIAHCSTCTTCSDNGGTYRLCTTGAALCAGEMPPYLNASGAWEKQPNVEEQLAFYFFNEHSKKCNICSSACISEVTDSTKFQEVQRLCNKGNRMARKVTKKYWMDEVGNIRRTGQETIECVIEEGDEKGKVVLVAEKDIFLPDGQRDEFIGNLLERERNQRMAGLEFAKRRKTFRERFNLGR